MVVKFEVPPVRTEGAKTEVVGLVQERKRLVIKYLIRKEEAGLFSIYVSCDGGRSARLLPRVSTDTAHDCYFQSIEDAKAVIEAMEAQ